MTQPFSKTAADKGPGGLNLDIDGWLRSLGLEQYEAAFRDNAIDEKVLPRLTAEDLKDSASSLSGTAARCSTLSPPCAVNGKEPPSQALPHAPALAKASAPPPTVAPAAEAVGERRYLTVMFCDLVDSTGIAARLDAEEWRDLVGAYLDAASAAVTGMGGHVAKKLGDGLMALFGYPVAQENDLERAVRAALSIQRALAELNRKNAGAGKPALAARIGIETGPGGGGYSRRDFRRRPEHRGAGAGAGRAGRGSGHGAGAAPNRRPVRRGGTRHAHAQGRARAGGPVPARLRERRRTSFRRA